MICLQHIMFGVYSAIDLYEWEYKFSFLMLIWASQMHQI